MGVGRFWSRFFEKFFADETVTLAASLAFYTVLSLAPLLILFVAISSRLSAPLQDELVRQVRDLIGGDAAQAVQSIVTGAKARADLTSRAGLAGIGTLLISAGLIFGQLKTALNRIFASPIATPESAGLARWAWNFVQDRLAQISAAVIFVLMMIATLITSSTLSGRLIRSDSALGAAAGLAGSFVFFALIFTLLFRYLPDRRQTWRTAWRGGLLAALLFEIGKELIGIYLGKSAVGSAYGAAGSLIVLLVWVYYSALITFVGAQISAVLAGRGRNEA